jgi:hypothetical protein
MIKKRFLQGTTCVVSCDASEYTNSSATVPFCDACTNNCAECSTGPSSCSKCDGIYFLNGTDCLDDCGSRFF